MCEKVISNPKSFGSLPQEPLRTDEESSCNVTTDASSSIKRRYSAEMRQKATAREKTRIKSIGTELKSLAKLLPRTGKGKKSHRKILQDSVTYIRAMEVELKVIGEKELLDSWSSRQGESRRRKGSDLEAFHLYRNVSLKKVNKLRQKPTSHSDTEGDKVDS